MVIIHAVEPRSIAEKAGLRAGDAIVAIDGHAINDVLDYRFYLAESRLSLSLCRDGAPFSVSVKKPQYDDIGLVFDTYLMDKKQSCRNKCVFCFIDQNPEGMRKDIYFKDDDSRLSFFFGNYITLTNMTDADIDRIIKMHISPVNVSVHTTNPALRVRMMNNKNAGECLRFLKKLAENGISLNAQIVLCKGLNDADELDRTLRDLSALFPALGSIAVVPAGLTAHREGLYPLVPFEKEDAAAVIRQIDAFRAENLKQYGQALVQASDEWYLTAGLPLPDEDYYDGYPQLDNGVGSLVSLETEVKDAITALLDEGVVPAARTVSLVTGVAAYPFLSSFCEAVSAAFPAVRIRVFRAVNRFFGESITVAGLLTGADMLDALRGQALGDELLIPAVTLRHEGDVFLDDMSKDEFAERLGVPVTPVANDGYELVRALLGLSS